MNLLKKLRENKGWSQIDLADAAGVGKATVERIEAGTVSPSPNAAKALAAVFDVEAGDIIEWCGLRGRLRDLAETLLERDPLPSELKGLPADIKSTIEHYVQSRSAAAANLDAGERLSVEADTTGDALRKAMDKSVQAVTSIPNDALGARARLQEVQRLTDEAREHRKKHRQVMDRQLLWVRESAQCALTYNKASFLLHELFRK